jgi:hypothetical protein
MQPIVQFVSLILSQSDTEITKESLLNSIYEIAGVPNPNQGNGGIQKTGAMMFGGGWATAEAYARLHAEAFVVAETESLRKRLKILRQVGRGDNDIGDLSIKDIEIAINRNYNAGMLERAQVLTNLKSTEWISPEDALSYIEMPDSLAVWKKGKEYWDDQHNLALEAARAAAVQSKDININENKTVDYEENAKTPPTITAQAQAKGEQ